MRSLTASDVVRAWETGRDRHSVDRALVLLALGYPDHGWDDLAGLSIGQRNGRLLDLREVTLGAKLTGVAQCSHCGESMEFQFAAAAIRQPEPADSNFVLDLDGYRLHCRLPTSRDLAAAGDLGDVAGARRLLFDRCVLEASQAGAPVAVDALPDAIIPALAAAMSELDPAAEIRFLLTCFNCGQDSSVLFDIGSYFWAEIEAYAKRLLLEVDGLARAYAWREADILAMSSLRRKFYLDLIGK